MPPAISSLAKRNGSAGKTKVSRPEITKVNTSNMCKNPKRAPSIPASHTKPRAQNVIGAALCSAIASLTAVESTTVLMAQEVLAPYCSELKRVVDLAITNERFASISGKPRGGDSADSRLTLPAWNDCAVYGARIYTCDSQPTGTEQEAQQAQEKIFHDLEACLGNAWAEAKDQSSLDFIVLHHANQPISMTLSTDQTDQNQYVVRLILFGRSN